MEIYLKIHIQKNRLICEVIRARNLVSATNYDISSPCVRIQIIKTCEENSKYNKTSSLNPRTRNVKRCEDPEWNEKLQIVFNQGNKRQGTQLSLLVQCWSSDRFESDDLIGYAIISISKIMNDDNAKGGWFTLLPNEILPCDIVLPSSKRMNDGSQSTFYTLGNFPITALETPAISEHSMGTSKNKEPQNKIQSENIATDDVPEALISIPSSAIGRIEKKQNYTCNEPQAISTVGVTTKAPVENTEDDSLNNTTSFEDAFKRMSSSSTGIYDQNGLKNIINRKMTIRRGFRSLTSLYHSPSFLEEVPSHDKHESCPSIACSHKKNEPNIRHYSSMSALKRVSEEEIVFYETCLQNNLPPRITYGLIGQLGVLGPTLGFTNLTQGLERTFTEFLHKHPCCMEVEKQKRRFRRLRHYLSR